MEQPRPNTEAPLTGYLLHKGSQLHIPMNGTFELTPMCNFSCKMCYVRQTQAQVDRHSRPMVRLDQWLEIAEQARDQGLLYLLLTGGEPFFYPEFQTLYEQLSRMGFLISINTNGSLIPDPVPDWLRESPPIRVNLTLYGASNATYKALCGSDGAFDRVDRTIAALQEAEIPLKLNCSLTPWNAHDLEAMVHYAEERQLILDVSTYMFPPLRRRPDLIGVNNRFTPREAAWYVIRTFALQHTEEEYRQYLQQLRQGIGPALGLDEGCVDPKNGKLRCRAGKAAFWITWDGYMTPCGTMPGPKTDLYTKSFAQAWQETVEKTAALSLSGICEACADRELCHTCAAMACTETGTAAGVPKYLCEMVTATREIAEEEEKRLSELQSQGDGPIYNEWGKRQ